MFCFEGSSDSASGSYFKCENIVLPQGTVYELYIADSGIYALVLPLSTYRELYLSLREILGTPRIRMYVLETGLYDFTLDSFGSLLSDEELTNQINSWIFSDSPVWDIARIKDLRDKMLRAAAVHRGEFVDSEGNVFILRHGKFVSASSRRSDNIFFLALFGGVFGLHRFSVGKLFSGTLYLLTGGLFLVGWLLDVIALLGGVFKDREGKYLIAPKNRFNSLLWLPAGMLVSVIAFLINTSLFSFSLDLLNAEMNSQIHSSGRSFVEELGSGAERFIRNIQLLTGD